VAAKCPKCQFDNASDSKFCKECGTQLSHLKDIPEVTKTIETPFPQFAPGTSLSGRYEIIKEIGKGGMGEVYLAEDTNLKRQVAIKVLPQQFALDKERLARFEREARLLASLNHPNIATIYGLEKSDGQQFLVMELVEGDTLAEQINKGPLPVDEALEVCRQIAEGLESAHETGIIHRDLKPSNVKVTPEGKVKILDFGLAKAFLDQSGDSDLSKSPAITEEMTRQGVILGTAAYMSPEQAKGKAVDKRTDIWAFGCILYECLTGRRTFKGETISEMLASILKDEPDWEALPFNLIPSVQHLLRRCMRKEPQQRLQSTGDARVELTDILDGVEPLETSVPALKDRRSRLWWFVAGLGLIGIIGWILGGLGIIGPQPKHEPRALTRFTLELPLEQQIFNKVDSPMLEISRDGRRLAWMGSGQDGQLIYTRTLDSLDVLALEGTRGLQAQGGLSISPDGRWIAFLRDRSLWKIPVEDGIATPLLEISNTESAIAVFNWGEGDKIVVLIGSVLYLFDLKGGPHVQLTKLDSDKNEILHTNPRFLPGGRAVLFTNCINNWNNCRLEAVSLDSLERKILVDDVSCGYCTSNGHLLFGRDGTIFAVPFAEDQLEVLGPETPVLSPVQMHDFGRIPSFIVSPNGTMVYTPGGQGILQRRIVWIGRDREVETLPIPPDRYFQPDLSPDGTQLVVNVQKGNLSRLHTFDFDRGILTQQISEGNPESGLWSPDSHSLVFSSNRSGSVNLYLKPVRTGGEVERLTESLQTQFSWSWSNDGRFLAFSEWDDPGGYHNLWLLPVEGDGRQPIPFVHTTSNDSQACFSPNGRWIAYMSKIEGRPEIFVQEIESDGTLTGTRHKVTRAGGWEPKWAPDGTELFYRSFDGSRLLVVAVDPETLKIGEESVVLDGVDFPTSDDWGESRFYDIAPDGERFLVMLEDLGPERAKLVVVENWFEELKRLVPTRR